MNADQIKIFERALQREKNARKQAEAILEKKSLELYKIAEELKEVNEKLEALLDEKDTQLKGVFENINDAYMIMDLQGNVLKINDAAIDFFGYDIKLEKLNVTQLIYKKDTAYAFKSFSELYKNGHFSDYTARIITKNNVVKWVHINASIIYDKNKKPIAAQGIIRDITEAKYNNELIQEQKNQLDAIVENAPFGIALTKNGKFIKTNSSFHKLLGYENEELLNKSIKEITHPEDISNSKENQKLMKKGKINNFVLHKKYIKKDETILFAKTNVNAVKNSNGEIKFEVAIIEDVTPEREKKLILDTIQNLTESILGKTNIHEISWEIISRIAKYAGTDECNLYLVNEDKKHLDQIGTLNRKTSAPLTINISNETLDKVISSGISIASILNNEKEKYASQAYIPIISEEKTIGVLHIKHQQKKNFNKENIKTLENIASLVSMQLKSAIHFRARTFAEKENDKLLKKLELNNLELQEYAHIVSHDLKSPLRSINALVSWIRDDNKDKLDSSSLANMDLIDVTLEKMEQLISDILIYSSIEKKNKAKENIDLNLLIKDLEQTLFVPKHISIVIKNKLPTLKTDEIKLRQLFQNIISNAVKFNNKKKGIIEFDIKEENKFYIFSIKDNGIGIEKKYFKKIFEIFNSLEENKESTGIGLSIVKKIVDLYEGEIWIKSELNQYTTFYIKLPKTLSNG